MVRIALIARLARGHTLDFFFDHSNALDDASARPRCFLNRRRSFLFMSTTLSKINGCRDTRR
jgi:hypothetical protein